MTILDLQATSTTFVGREAELADITRLLSDPACRLLTLVGPGGIGKTRLAMQASASQLPNFSQGVYFVALSAVSSPDLIPAAIAGALGVTLYGSESPGLQIVQYLHAKQMLLIMDNFEHLLAGTDLLTDILEAAPTIKLLVTSRERLNLREEWTLVLDGLRFPTGGVNESLENYSAVQLFVQRACQIQVNFSLAENAEAVRAICQRVEGMPLGLELAATWLRALSCRQIALEIERSLSFLTSPLRNVPERHRSLRNVFEQSWNLLTTVEQDVLMRLSVFRGGFDREAAEQVAGASLPLLAGLVDKSLIRLNASDRYDLHELVRQYTAAKLLESGVEWSGSERHCDYFLTLAEGAEAHTFGRGQIAWFDRLQLEFDNLRAALAWSQATERGLRLAAAMGWFFSERSHWAEGLDWLERTLAANPDAPVSLRAKALHSAGTLSGLVGDNRRAQTLCEQAFTLAQAANDRWNMAWALSHLALYGVNRNVEALLDQSLALFRELNDQMGIAHTLIRRAWKAFDLHDYPYTRLLAEEAMLLAEESGDAVIAAWANFSLGRVYWFQDNDVIQARVFFDRSSALFDQAHVHFFYLNLVAFADVERALGNITHAQRLYDDSLISIRNFVSPHPDLPFVIAALANVARLQGKYERAARLLGWAENSHLIKAEIAGSDYVTYSSDVAAVRSELGEAVFDAARQAGKSMTYGQAIAYGLEGRDSSVMEAPLSSRELEVLRLVADGFSNAEIAETLVLAHSTVKWYVNELFKKLEVSSRTEAISRARELRLLA